MVVTHCCVYIGLGTGLLKDGEVGISATNRNFKGRMGSLSSLAYLASPGKSFMDWKKNNIGHPFIYFIE